MTTPTCALSLCVRHDAAKHGCYHYNNNVNGIMINLKTRRQANPESKFDVENTVKNAVVCIVASRIAKAVSLCCCKRR